MQRRRYFGFMRRRIRQPFISTRTSPDTERDPPLPNKQENTSSVTKLPGATPSKKLSPVQETTAVQEATLVEEIIPAKETTAVEEATLVDEITPGEETTSVNPTPKRQATTLLNRLGTLPPEIRLIIYPHLCFPDVSSITVCQTETTTFPRAPKGQLYMTISAEEMVSLDIKTMYCNAWIKVGDTSPEFLSIFCLSLDDDKPLTEQDLQKLLLESEPELCRAHPELRDELLPLWFNTYRPAIYISRLDQYSLSVLEGSVQYLIDNAWAGAQLFGITCSVDSDLAKIPSLGPLLIRLVKLLGRYQSRVTAPKLKASYKPWAIEVSKDDRCMRKERDLFQSVFALTSLMNGGEVMDDARLEAGICELFSGENNAIDWSDPSAKRDSLFK